MSTARVIYRRNADGDATFPDSGVVVKLPQDKGVLSIKPSQLVPRADFSVDPDWVLIDGARAFKQLTNVGRSERIWVWPPSLRDLPAMETRWRRQCAAVRDYNTFVRGRVVSALEVVGYAHCPSADGAWTLYTARSGPDGTGVDREACAEPSKPRNVALGKAFATAERRIRDLRRREYKFRIALDRAMLLRLDVETGSVDGGYMVLPGTHIGKMAHITVNGRNYWYRVQACDRAERWTKWQWSEQPTIKINA